MRAAFVIPGMVLAMALAGCAGRGAAGPGTGPEVSSQVAAIVNGMTLPDKVGQLLVPTVPGRTADAGGAGLVRRYHVGGVIYFGSNISDAAHPGAGRGAGRPGRLCSAADARQPGMAYHALLRAVRHGRISLAQLDASVARIVSLKLARGLLSEPPPPRPPRRTPRTRPGSGIWPGN